MKAVLRERLLERLLLLPALVDLHKERNNHFVPKTLEWLAASEKALEPLRSSLVSRIAGLRSQLIAMEDGLISEYVSTQQRSARKKQSVFASHVISILEQDMRFEINKIDDSFSELRDKLAQLIAIVSSQTSLPTSMHLTSGYLDQIWQILHSNKETLSMSAYIQAVLDNTDRQYLLQDLLANFLQSQNPAD